MLRAFSLSTMLVLAGCASLSVMSSIPVSTLSRLASLDLDKISPAQLRIAARLPKGLQPKPDGATVQLQWTAGVSRETLNFTLVAAAGADEVAELSRYDIAGSRIWIFRLNTEDVTRLNAMRSNALEKRGRVAISISGGVDACHSAGLSTGALPTTTYLRTDGSGYFALVENLDLRSVVSRKDLATKVPPCR